MDTIKFVKVTLAALAEMSAKPLNIQFDLLFSGK